MERDRGSETDRRLMVDGESELQRTQDQRGTWEGLTERDWSLIAGGWQRQTGQDRKVTGWGGAEGV